MGPAVTTPSSSSSSSSSPPPMNHNNIHRNKNIIDNSKATYIPIKLRDCGVYAMCRPDVLVKCPQILQDLNEDLSQCLEILPESVHPLIRRTRIWVNTTYYLNNNGGRYRGGGGYSYNNNNNTSYNINNDNDIHDINNIKNNNQQTPKVLSHTTTHHHEGWLLWARDRPDKTLGIEIYNCFDYRRMRLHWNGCGLMMHELCHKIHQFCLEGGLTNDRVRKAYERARVTGLYDAVRRRDWAGKQQDFDLAYATVDFKEFWAEMSVTYWSKGYAQLDTQDRNRILLCSPPFMEPNVVARLRRIGVEGVDAKEACQPKPGNLLFELLLPFFADKKKRFSCHCNKFYPFTNGQLKYHDVHTFQTIDDLWQEIAEWEDPWNNNTYKKNESVVCGKAPGCFPIPPLFCSNNNKRKPTEVYANTVYL